MNNELEVVLYEKLRHVKVLLNRITYRNYHMHGAFEILLVLDGTARLNRPGNTILLKPGSLVILNLHEPHEIDADGESVLTVVFQVSRHFCQEYVPTFQNIFFLESDLSKALGERPGIFSECTRRVCQASLSYLQGKPGFDLTCLSHITKLFELLLKHVPHDILSDDDRMARKRKIQRVNRIAGYLDQNYLMPVRLQELAELEGLTPTYISHLFTEYFGIPFQKYLGNLRFEKAMTLLRNTELSQTEIATASGFSDPKYFAQMFQQRMGCSFREYRNDPNIEARIPTANTTDQSILEYHYFPEDSIALITVFLHSFCPGNYET